MAFYRKYSYLWITILALYFFYRAGDSPEHFVLHIVLGVSQLVIACWAYEQSIDRTTIPTDSRLIKSLKRFPFGKLFPVKTALTLFSVFLMASLMFLMTYCFERCVASDKQLAGASVVESQADR